MIMHGPGHCQPAGGAFHPENMQPVAFQGGISAFDAIIYFFKLRSLTMLFPDAPAAADWTQSRRRTTAIAVAALLHLALLCLLLRPAHDVIAPDARIWVTVLAPRPAAVATRPPAPAPPERAAAQSAPRAARPPAAAPAVTVAALPPTPDDPLAAPAPLPAELDLAAAPAAAPRGDTLAQALKAVGAIDRQLQAGRPQTLAPSPDSLDARLAKGFAAARAAVGPKWYEQARTELISAPNDPRRIYRITTALGKYCVFYPDKASMTTNLDARSGRGNFGEPKISSCPIPY